ncbi:MAG: response regulator [Alteromonadaceae bacterium]|nr:response regulator [Alteromonadaceae bacterium]
MNTILTDNKDQAIFSAKTVLVVDNVDNIRSTVVAMLGDLGCKKVVQASNGVEALSIISKLKVDLIISENQIPKMDGVELLRKVRLDPRTAKVPFVMTSATIEQSEVIRAIKNGVSEYVVKPFSARILTQRLKKAIAQPIKHTASFVNAQKAGKEEAKKPKLRVLVVDDIPDNIDVISDLLRGEYQIKAATNGPLALKICASEQPPDLVLLDIMMPDMDGLEVCKRLKSNSKTQHITVIFLTALDQTEDVVKGLDLGAVDYITKPINPAIVKARVRTHCRAIESHKQTRDQVDTLMEMARLKEEFDRIAKNDLKYPLEEISGSINNLQRYLRDPNKVKSTANAIKSSVSQLTHMVDNMLTLAKIEEGTYKLAPVRLELNKVLEDVIHTFATSTERKRLEIHNELDAQLFVDGEELLTISLFSNLFKNAVEAALRGSAIKVSSEAGERYHKITIHNSGAVPDEIKSQFFDKYIACGKKNGTGIGTYAAKLMVEIQKGRISFDSSEDAGTNLHVELPRS